MTTTFSRAELEAEGFEGWVPLTTLDMAEVPTTPGVYLAYRVASSEPELLVASRAGRFKGREPSIDVPGLRSKWVTGGNTVYIGKANDLRRRLRQYQQFGGGAPVGHWGGRYIWQLADHRSVLIAWRQSSKPEIAEAELLRRFLAAYGKPPFANIALPSGVTKRRDARAVSLTPGERVATSSASDVHEFRIAGRDVSLTRADVEAAMADAAAEPVQKHAVRIGGQLYPVVQILERATSVPRAETRSARARSVLQQLGFTLLEVA